MKPNEVEAWRLLADNVTFGGAMLECELAIEVVRCTKGFGWLRMSMLTSERDDPMILFRLHTSKGLPKGPPSVEWIYGAVREFWLHEFAEGFRVDGALYKDPHPGNHNHGRTFKAH